MPVKPTSVSVAHSRWRFSLSSLLLFTTVAAVHLAAYAMILRSVDHPLPAEFVVTLTVVSTATTWFLLLLARYRRGELYFRLPWRRSVWVVIAVYFATPLTFIALAELLPTTIPQAVCVGGITGLTYSLVFAFFQMAGRTIDLGENGIVTNPFGFVPWSRINPGDIELHANGDLRLGNARSGSVATVPTDDRAAVEALLKEKLGEANGVDATDVMACER